MGWFISLFLLICSIVVLLPIFFYMPTIMTISLLIAVILGVYGGIKTSNQKNNKR